ncbi:biopolymer transporter ExbD [Flavobacterium sp. DG1-102-2]|uniref:ExbD/TolR family protein n=1 Tax=Flavobacterium sp. DG1-102-2 TaxID=3081663 RepID=UPI00294A961F|nr:biopolymer transporter ExbD [Flavobacterium sp. DG1-102-2]MDV6169150.1 biopolymer transporter ExbD [Flavobacterium sp. DG1-102-2]
MAELNTGDGGGKKGGKVRAKKSNPGVDLTAMVDLAFLLITFFMLTTTLSKPQSMPLAMPDKTDDPVDPGTKIPEERLLTVLIGDKNQIMWYRGKFETPVEAPTKAVFGKDGIRKDLLKEIEIGKAIAKRDGGKEGDGLIVNIKASDKASYKNLVDMLDEMAITHPQLYAIGDITPGELDLLTKSGLY